MKKEAFRKSSVALRVLAFAIMLAVLNPIVFSAVSAAEKDFYISENYALGKKCRTNNAYSQAPGSMALDGEKGSYWRTNSTCKDDFVWLYVDLGGRYDINFIYLNLYLQDHMSAVRLQYTSDPVPSESSDWQDLKLLTGSAVDKSVGVSFDTVKATGVRFYAYLSQKTAGLREMQVYFTSDAEAAEKELNRVYFRAFDQPESVDAQIVSVGENGELIYADHDGNGGTLIDYSRVGYHNGEEPVPTVKVVKTLEAGDKKDHTEMIQQAIDEVAAMSEDKRGAILLKAGKYTVSDTLKINASGIVLRGEGQGENGTVIYDVRKKAEITTLQIKGDSAYSGVEGTTATLTDAYVAMGEIALALSAVSAYSAGDNVKVVCKPNDLWIKTLGMDVLPGDGVTQWSAKDYVLTYERTVTAVDGDGKAISIDTGIPLTLDKKYFTVTVQKITDDKARVTESGVENIRFLSYYNGKDTDEEHGWTAISLSNCRNCWVKDVTAKNYAYATVQVGVRSICVTVEGCSFLEPIAKTEGGRLYSFCVSGGQYTLVKNCYSYDSRHDYVVQQRVGGPNVFLDCVAEDSNSVSEPHHRWSTGTLYDNIYQIGQNRLGNFEAINRGSSGTGHGWAGANTVFWNCLSPATVVGKPQTEQNFAIGVYGLFSADLKKNYLGMYSSGFVKPSITTPNYPETQVFDGSPLHGNGYIESAYNPVNPSSLYRAQLSFRLYGDATKNVAPNAPILEYPMADSVQDSYAFTVSGIRDRNAEKVFVYIDGMKFEAKLDSEGYGFSFDAYLQNGYHDVCVTQVAGGIESSRNAVRTVRVNGSGEFNPPEDSAVVTPPADGNDGGSVIFFVIGAAAVTIGAVTVAVVKIKKRKNEQET